MKSARFLRIASILALLQYSAHTFLFLSATPTHGQEEMALIEAMKSHRWDFAGSMRSYSEIIKAEVRISRKEGDSFSAFNSMVTGKNLSIVPNKMLVQSL